MSVNSSQNPYREQQAKADAIHSLEELANSRFCYVNLETKEVVATHVFHRIYEWFRGVFKGQDLCNQKLVGLYFIREITLLAAASPLDDETLANIKTVAENLNLFPTKDTSTEKESPSFFSYLSDLSIDKKTAKQAIRS